MKRHKFLLPYRWQIAGWIILPVSLIAMTLLLTFFLGKISDTAMECCVILDIILGGLSLIMIAFSEEKSEDEFIEHLRGKSLAIAAGITFTIAILWFIFQITYNFYETPDMTDTGTMMVYNALNLMSSVFMMFFIYIVTLKTNLAIYKWRCNHEK